MTEGLWPGAGVGVQRPRSEQLISWKPKMVTKAPKYSVIHPILEYHGGRDDTVGCYPELGDSGMKTVIFVRGVDSKLVSCHPAHV